MASVAPDEQSPMVDKPKDAPGMAVQDNSVGKNWFTEGVALCFEILFCVCLTLWQADNKAKKTEQMLTDESDVMYVVIWGTFISFILARIIIFIAWQKDALHISHAVWAGLFMFCSTFQFILYMAYYYTETENWTYKTVGAETVVATWKELEPAHYEWTCTLFDEGYKGGTCDASTDVLGKSCCTIRTFVLKTPASDYLVEKPLWIHMSTTFGFLKWASFLSMSFIWKEIPFIKKTAADTDFLANIWLDILDSVCMGVTYVNSAVVLNAKYGIDEDGRATDEDESIFNLVFWTWFICFSLALISPTLYIVLGFCDKGDEVDKRCLQDVLTDLTNATSMLDDDRAKELVKEAIEFQKADYKGDEGDEETAHKVKVIIDTHDTGVGIDPEDDDEHLKLGHAKLCEEGEDDDKKKIAGCYDVKYDDGKTEERVDISRIIPDFDPESNPCLSPTCCTGWCKCRHLCNNEDERYERIANFLDHFRSVLFLDIPFGCIRYYYHSPGQSIFLNLMMLKNVAFCIINVLLIFSCGVEKATCCGRACLDFFVHMVKGSKLAAPALIMPGGLARLATEAAITQGKAGIDAKLAQLKLHKSWLVIQMDKFDVDGSGMNPEQEIYKTEIEEVGKKIAQLTAQQAMMHDTTS